MWDRSRDSLVWSVALAVSLIGTAALAAVLLDRASGFVPDLAPAVMVAAVLVACVLLLARSTPVLGSTSIRSKVALVAAVAGLVAMLAGPTAYSLATAGKTLSGGDPLAGPVSAELGVGGPGGGAPGAGFGRRVLRAGSAPGVGLRPPGVGAPSGGVSGGAPPAAGEAGAGSPPNLFGNGVRAGTGTSGGSTAAGSAGAPPAGAFAGASRGNGVAARLGAGVGVGAGPGANVSKTLISYLKAHQGKATYLVAAVGSSTAGPIALESGRNVINMGGFMGSDPAPSLAKLKGFIDSGQLHYVLLSSSSGGSGEAAGARTGGMSSGILGARAGVGGPGGLGGDASAATRAAISERDEWIEKHGTVVHVSGESSSAGGTTLYYFAG
jgi:hypothetical protein